MRVRLSEPDLVERLAVRLRTAGCLAERDSVDTLAVVHLEAADVGEARLELEFFVRAWQLEHPEVDAELIP